MDIATAPMLVDLSVNGQPVKAVAVMGKQAFLYLFNRVTGEPMFPIEERPVAAVRRAGREDVADAAVSDQTAGLRLPGRRGAET